MSKYTDATNWYKPTTGIRYKTTKSLEWELGSKGSGLWIRVPVGFIFDVSIPKPLRWLLSPHNPKLLKAACLHDYTLHVLGWKRVAAASTFSEALRADNVNSLLRLMMVYAVIGWKWK